MTCPYEEFRSNDSDKELNMHSRKIENEKTVENRDSSQLPREQP